MDPVQEHTLISVGGFSRSNTAPPAAPANNTSSSTCDSQSQSPTIGKGSRKHPSHVIFVWRQYKTRTTPRDCLLANLGIFPVVTKGINYLGEPCLRQTLGTLASQDFHIYKIDLQPAAGAARNGEVSGSRIAQQEGLCGAKGKERAVIYRVTTIGNGEIHKRHAITF